MLPRFIEFMSDAGNQRWNGSFSVPAGRKVSWTPRNLPAINDGRIREQLDDAQAPGVCRSGRR